MKKGTEDQMIIVKLYSNIHNRADLPLLKLDFGLPSGFAFKSWVSKDILVDNSLVQGDVHRVPGTMAEK
jgi:hypothetical protein